MREYPVSLLYKTILYLFVLGLVTGAGVSIHHAIATTEHDLLFTAVLAALLVALSVYIIWEVRASIVTLDDHSMTQRSAFSSRTVLLTDVEGYREGEKGYFFLVLKTGKKQPVPQFIARRDELIDWVRENYQDLDAVELEKNQAHVLDDDRFGATVEQREENLKKAKQFVRIANIAGVAISLWFLFYPVPYDGALALVLLSPFFALFWVWRSKGIVRFYSSKTSPFPSIGTLIGFPIGTLTIKALLAYNIYNFPAVGWIMFCGGVAVFIWVTLAAGREVISRERKKAFFLVGLVFAVGLYCYGALIIANCHFDRARPRVWPVAVIGKHINQGKTTSYYVAVSPWGKYSEGTDVEVGKSFYQRVETGDSIRIVLKPGKLGIPWYYAADN